MALDQHWLLTVALVTASVVAVLANALLLLVFCRRRGLRTVSNRFVINLLITNLFSSLLLIPLLIADQEVAGGATTSVNVREVLAASGNRTLLFAEELEETLRVGSLIETSKEIIIHDLPNAHNRTAPRRLQLVLEKNVTDVHARTRTILCYVAQISTSFVCTASILSVLLIGVDQYFAVLHSLRYHSYIDRFRSSVLIGVTWLVSALFGGVGALIDNEGSLWRFCRRSAHLFGSHLRTLNSIYALLYFVFVILLPFLAICIIYVCIYHAARRNSERMRRSTAAKSCSHGNLHSYVRVARAPSDANLAGRVEDGGGERARATLPKVHSAPNFSNYESQRKVARTCSDRAALVAKVKPHNGFISNIKHKISNASVFRYREETRAAKISLLVILMVLICYTPYGLAVVLNSSAIAIRTPQLYNHLSLVLLVFSNISNPFLFAYRNRRVRREIAKLFGGGSRRGGLPIRKRVEPPREQLLGGVARIPQVVVTCKVETEKSILKRVCSGRNWSLNRKCTLIAVPESCLQTESARGSFSSASTQISSEE